MIFMNLFASTLIVTPAPDVINTFEQLAKKRNMIPLFLKFDAYWNQFLEAKSGPYKEIWNRCRKMGEEKCFFDFYSLERMLKSLEAVDNGNSAVIFPSYMMRLYIPIFKGWYEKKEFHIATEHMMGSSYCFIYSKNISRQKRSDLDSK